VLIQPLRVFILNMNRLTQRHVRGFHDDFT
jgi:hypothetical protein